MNTRLWAAFRNNSVYISRINPVEDRRKLDLHSLIRLTYQSKVSALCHLTIFAIRKRKSMLIMSDYFG